MMSGCEKTSHAGDEGDFIGTPATGKQGVVRHDTVVTLKKEQQAVAVVDGKPMRMGLQHQSRKRPRPPLACPERKRQG